MNLNYISLSPIKLLKLPLKNNKNIQKPLSFKSNNYDTFISQKENNKSYIKEIKQNTPKLISLFAKSSDLLPDYPLLDVKYKDCAFYDLPYKFAIAVNNQKNKTGQSYIADSIPEIFKNCDEKKLFSTLDNLSVQLRKTSNKKVDFRIDNETFSTEYISAGQEGSTYKITKKDYQDCDSVIMKIYNNPDSIGAFGIFGSIAIQREATKAKCSDIAKFLLANPLYENDQNTIKGAWQISQDVSGLSIDNNINPFINWLRKYNLLHYDLEDNNTKNGIIYDFGCIAPNGYNTLSSIFKYVCSNSKQHEAINNLFLEYKQNKTTKDIYKELI